MTRPRELKRPATERALCMAPGCAQTAAIRCSYLDRRRRRCPTTWCARHGTIVDGEPHCRRHASTVTALSNGYHQTARPDLENRAPSLVGWMAGMLDEQVRAALLAGAPPGARVVGDPVRPVLTSRQARARCWQRDWKLVDNAGVLHRVSVEVSEDDDSLVGLRVGRVLIGRATPPWIESRRRGDTADDASDLAARQALTAAMANAVVAVLRREGNGAAS